MRFRYRLYVDEVGSSSLAKATVSGERFLSLTGAIISDSDAKTVLLPELNRLKYRYFAGDHDDPVIFHRKELSQKKPPFDSLLDPKVEERFNRDFLGLLARLDFRLMTVVLDKQEHVGRYGKWADDPYYYCFLILLERYLRFLGNQDGEGDVIAESRGSTEDARLKAAFRRTCDDGAGYATREACSDRLTSHELKLRSKKLNIAGLQLVDLLAFPSYLSMKLKREGTPMNQNFNREIVETLIKGKKYHRNLLGVVNGVGKKWLP